MPTAHKPINAMCLIYFNRYVCPELKKLSKSACSYAVAMNLYDIINVIMTYLLLLNNLKSTYHSQMLKLFPVCMKSREKCTYDPI